MFKLIFYVPNEAVDSVKDALFSAGAGKQGHYACCSWETLGKGQFMPLEGAEPHVGNINALSKVQELRVEMLVEEELADAVIAALKLAHPYEKPAYEVYRLDRWGQ